MKKVSIMLCVFVLLIINSGYSLKFVAYGDTRSYASIHEDIVHKFAEDNPELVLHVGDLWDDIGESAWKYAFTSNTVANALLNNNKVLVSRGNHESQGEVLQFTPSLLLNDEFLYSFKEGNCFFVSMEYEPASNNTWLETQLQSTESQSADWRFIWAHKPIYSSGQGHPSDGSNYSNFRKLCDKYHVTMFFSGHDHHYERSYLIYDGEVVDESTEIEFEDSLNGTIYYVAGGGGAPVYGLQSGKWWGDASVRTTDNHYCLINTDTPNKVEFVTKDKNGTIIDQLTITKTINLYTTLSVPDGGELWEQNSTHTVTWDDNLDEKVKMDLYKGGALNLTITDSTESDGSYDWDIPLDQEVGDDYSIKITSVDDATVTDESNAYFSIITGTAINVASGKIPSSITLKYYGSKISFQILNFGGNDYPHTSLKIYDTKGKQMQTLVDGRVRTGRHSVNFNEMKLPAGLYICRLETGGVIKTTNIIIRK